jgi:hypothetical protein
MSSITLTRCTPTAEVVSNILNWVCPECGGRMGGQEGLEFKCQGRCRTDWRELWELGSVTAGVQLPLTRSGARGVKSLFRGA